MFIADILAFVYYRLHLLQNSISVSIFHTCNFLAYTTEDMTIISKQIHKGEDLCKDVTYKVNF